MTNATAARMFFSRFAAGHEPNGVRPDDCGPFAAQARELWGTYERDGIDAAQAQARTWLNDPKQVRGLAALIASETIDAPEIVVDVPDCPPLPACAQFDFTIGAGAGAWLDTYVDYATQVAPMAPRYWHESAALWLAATAVARRLKVEMSFDTIYPNVFALWVAPTTLWGKTTSLKIARRLANQTFPFLLASQDTTVEALVSDMAGCEPGNKKDMSDRAVEEWRQERNYAAQRGWAVDEMSGLLASAGKEYNAGFLEALMIFYDCEDRFTRSTRAQGRIAINNACLSLIGASTPAVMNPHLDSQRLWAMGWWPRFAILTPEQAIPHDQEQSEDVAEPVSLARQLRALFDRLPPSVWPAAPDARSVPLGRGVFETWSQYSRAMRREMLSTHTIDERLHGTYGRLPVQAIKIATLLAALDWQRGNVPMIELPHMIRAIGIGERWRASAHRALAATTANEMGTLRARIMRQISLHHDHGGLTLRDLSRLMRDVDVSRLEVALQELVKLTEVEEALANQGQRGRPTVKYRIPVS